METWLGNCEQADDRRKSVSQVRRLNENVALLSVAIAFSRTVRQSRTVCCSFARYLRTRHRNTEETDNGICIANLGQEIAQRSPPRAKNFLEQLLPCSAFNPLRTNVGILARRSVHVSRTARDRRAVSVLSIDRTIGEIREGLGTFYPASNVASAENYRSSFHLHAKKESKHRSRRHRSKRESVSRPQSRKSISKACVERDSPARSEFPWAKKCDSIAFVFARAFGKHGKKH